MPRRGLVAAAVAVVLAASGVFLWSSDSDNPTTGTLAPPPSDAVPPDSDAGGGGAPSTPAVTDDESSVDVARAQDVVDDIPVKGRAPSTGYSRDAFGSAWEDVDDNGCDTRNDILQRDLEKIQLRDDCIVETGVLVDPYSAVVVDFQRGQDTSSDVQIDHVVAMSNAWQTGAQFWSDEQRLDFANDPANLLAVRGDLNQQKGAGDAATWLPPDRSFRCEYVSIQVLAKHDHGLWLTPAERDAIVRELGRC